MDCWITVEFNVKSVFTLELPLIKLTTNHTLEIVFIFDSLIHFTLCICLSYTSKLIFIISCDWLIFYDEFNFHSATTGHWW
jgi:hypothetical protein